MELEIKQPKEKASYRQKNNRIKQLEDELRRIRSEYNLMKEELSDVKATPLVLLKPAITPEIAYNLMVEHPESSKFIYKKYRDLKSVIEEVCDPENPLYKKDIADNLKDKFEVRSITDDVLQLRSEKLKMEKEKTDAEKYIKTIEEKIEYLDAQMKPKQDEIENLHKLIANLKSDPVVRKINDILSDMEALLQTIHEIQPDRIGIRMVSKEVLLPGDKVLTSITELKKFLQSDDYFSPSNVDKVRQEGMMEMKRIGEEVATTNKAYLENDIHDRDEKMMKILLRISEIIGDGRSIDPMHLQGIAMDVEQMIIWMERKQTLKRNIFNRREDKKRGE